jgi:hypothetical protein
MIRSGWKVIRAEGQESFRCGRSEVLKSGKSEGLEVMRGLIREGRNVGRAKGLKVAQVRLFECVHRLIIFGASFFDICRQEIYIFLKLFRFLSISAAVQYILAPPLKLSASLHG